MEKFSFPQYKHRVVFQLRVGFQLITFWQQDSKVNTTPPDPCRTENPVHPEKKTL